LNEPTPAIVGIDGGIVDTGWPGLVVVDRRAEEDVPDREDRREVVVLDMAFGRRRKRVMQAMEARADQQPLAQPP